MAPQLVSAMIVGVRVLITGSRGFVGPWLIAHLEECGDEALELPEVTDIRDPDGLRTAMAAAEPDAVCHLAAQSSVRQSWDDPAGTFAVNALGTVNVCDVASALDPSPRLLLVSSAEVYGRVGPEHLPVGEDHPFAPATPYAASKASAEMVGLQAWLGRGLEVIRTRPFNHTGPGQSESFVIPALAAQVAQASRGELDRITTGNLEVSRDITDVRDVVRAYRRAPGPRRARWGLQRLPRGSFRVVRAASPSFGDEQARRYRCGSTRAERGQPTCPSRLAIQAGSGL